MAAAVFRVAALALVCAACTSLVFDARTFEGTRWKVAAINGRSIPLSGDYQVEFQKGRMSGRFGCNPWTASYALSGETLEAEEVESATTACSEPVMSLERQGLAVLGEPMRCTFRGRKLTLSNRKGSIALRRQS